MHLLKNDYSEGAHPRILEALVRTNADQSAAYTEDEHCRRAAELILAECGLTAGEADVHFMVGGTAANACVLAGLLERPYDSVICTPDGHINTHETGAVEATGHKVLATRDADGLVSPSEVERIVAENAAFGRHMTRPRAVYVSNATELGGIYTLAHLEELRRCADELGLKLFLDGARLGSALTSPESDMTLADVARLTDAFYIGGTKNGLLLGEAVVVKDEQLRRDFPWMMKRQAGLLAKGRLLGVQFEAAFEDGLYWECARNANEQAAKLREGLVADGWTEWKRSPTNQLFFEMPKAQATEFVRELGCEVFFDLGETLVVRFVTSWATQACHIEDALALSRKLSQGR